MEKPDKQKDIDDLKEDLQNFHDDWEALYKDEAALSNKENLSKFALDIQKLLVDAKKLMHHKEYEEQSEIVISLLTTPWGAPFVSKITLHEAAKSYKDEESEDSALFHLLKDFMNYKSVFNNQLYCVLEDYRSDLQQP